MNEALLHEFMHDPETPLKRFTVDQVMRMTEAGIFSDGERYELLDGFLISKDSADMDREYSRRCVLYHSLVDGLNRRLTEHSAGSGYSVRCKSPVRLDEDSTPVPELAIIRGNSRDYLPEYPRGDSVQLVVEVEFKWLARPREIEKDRYARAGIPQYWLIDLRTSRMEVNQGPDTERGIYAECQTFMRDQTVMLSLPGLANVKLAVHEILSGAI